MNRAPHHPSDSHRALYEVYRLLADVGRRRLAGEREAALAQDDRSGQPCGDYGAPVVASAGAPHQRGPREGGATP